MILRTLTLSGVVAFFVACGPVPGGSLAGETAPAPADWSLALAGERTFCEIESRPADPHSIQLDCFLYENQLHVQSHRWVFAPWWPVESWAEIWIKEPDLVVRIDGVLYELMAVHVVEPAERNAILVSRGYDPVPEGIAVFRFDARL